MYIYIYIYTLPAASCTYVRTNTNSTTIQCQTRQWKTTVRTYMTIRITQPQISYGGIRTTKVFLHADVRAYVQRVYLRTYVRMHVRIGAQGSTIHRLTLRSGLTQNLQDLILYWVEPLKSTTHVSDPFDSNSKIPGSSFAA